METRHVEIQRFARKAAGYRAALDAAPHARALECAVVGSVLSGYCRQRHLDPGKLVIVDLMAGSGYLSGFLATLGFKLIHAVEACTEMTPGVAIPRDPVIRHVIEDLDHLPSVLKEIKPGAIVSLAGFHHLIHHEGKRVDRLRSILWQQRVLEECVAELPADGLLLVADIVDPDAVCDSVSAIRYWDRSVFSGDTWLPSSLGSALTRAGNLSEYNTIVQQEIGALRESAAVRWFREVINMETSVGHDDVAFSRDLLETLCRHHEIGWGRFYCPWIFDSEDQMIYYYLHKFGYDVDGRSATVDRSTFVNKINTVLAMRRLPNGQVAVGWDLGLLIMHGAGDKEVGRAVIEGNLASGALAVMLLLRLALMHVGYGAVRDAVPYVEGVGFVFFGILVSALVNWWLRQR